MHPSNKLVAPLTVVNANPEFKPPYDIFTRIDKTSNLVERYQPTGWQVVVTPTQLGDTLPNLEADLPAPSVHPHDGVMLAIETFEDRPSIISLSQFGVPLKADQRYVLALKGTAKLRLLQAGDQNSILIRVVYHVNGFDVVQPWKAFNWDHPGALLLEVFDSAKVQAIGYSIQLHNRYGNLDGIIDLTSGTIEEVGKEYANDFNVVLPPGGIVTPPPPPPDPVPNPDAPNLGIFIGAGILLFLAFIAYTLVQLTGRQTSAQLAGVISVEEAAEILLAAINTIIMGGATGGLLSVVIEPIVNVIKFFVKGWSAKLITFGVATGLTVLVWILMAVGRGAQVETILGLLQTAASILLAILTSIYGSQQVYNFALKRNIFLFGWRRTPAPRAVPSVVAARKA